MNTEAVLWKNAAEEARAERDLWKQRWQQVSAAHATAIADRNQMERGWDQCRALLKQQIEDVTPMREENERLIAELAHRNKRLLQFASISEERDRLVAELKITDCSNPYGCRRQASFDEWRANLMAEAQDVRERWIPKCDKLRAALKEAIEEVESWAAYASPYFQEKHDLQGSLKRLRGVLDEHD